MKSTVYIETTVPSYLTAWRSPELVMAANQEATRKWWDESRVTFDLFVSELVIGEMSVGDPDAVKRRLDAVENIPELALTNKAEELAAKLLEGAALPQKAKADALHIAIATVHGMDYLLTWNCTHIANAIMRPRIESICRSAGYEPPVICTPPRTRGGAVTPCGAIPSWKRFIESESSRPRHSATICTQFARKFARGRQRPAVSW